MQDAHDSLSIDMAIGRWKSWHIAVTFVKSPNIKPISCCCLTNVCIREPLCLHALTLILAGINNYIHYKVLDEITYWLPNFNGATAEVWGWMSNLIPHFIVLAITYPCWIHVSKRGHSCTGHSGSHYWNCIPAALTFQWLSARLR